TGGKKRIMLKDKIAAFYISDRGGATANMSLGTVDHCHFTWRQCIPLVEDQPRSIGAFYARRPDPRDRKGSFCSIMRKRILKRGAKKAYVKRSINKAKGGKKW
ncbi:MAG: hypothetical protein ACNYVW_00515, partial [Methanosarcinales archaeon]